MNDSEQIGCLMLLAFSIIIYCRVDGIDLTEGQLFIQYLPGWAAACWCALMSVVISTSSRNNKKHFKGPPNQRPKASPRPK